MGVSVREMAFASFSKCERDREWERENGHGESVMTKPYIALLFQGGLSYRQKFDPKNVPFSLSLTILLLFISLHFH